MVKVVWEKVVEYDMPEDNFESVDEWHKSVVSRVNNLPAMAGSNWRGNLGQRERDALRPALTSRFNNRKENDPTTFAGGGKALRNFIGEYKITLVSPQSVQNQMNAYYEMLDILNADKKVVTTPPFITVEQEKGDVNDAIERALHYVLYTRDKSVSPKKIVGIAMGFISPRYENLKSEMKNIPKKLVPRYIQLLKDYESVEGEDLKKEVLKKYSDIEKYTQSGPQTLSEPFEFYLVGKSIPVTHFGFVIDDEPYEIELEKAIRLIKHDKAAIARLHDIKPGGPKHPPDEGGKYYFAISNDPVINLTKSTTRYWEHGRCERAWTVGHMHQGVYDDIKMGNPTLMVMAGHQPPEGWPDSQNKNRPSNPPKEGELLGRLTMRWGWREGIPSNGIGIGPDSSIYGMRGVQNLKGATNNIILALMQIARANGLSDYERLGFKSPCSKTGQNYTYQGSADAGNMRGGNLTYQGKGRLKEGVEINFDLEAAQAEGIQYGALNRVSRPNIDISIRRVLSLNNGIWAVEGGEECIARLIMAKDQQIHLNLAGNVNCHPEALMLLAQTMYETFPELITSYLQANTIDKIILSNPNCTPEIIDWIKKNHQGYIVPAGSIARRNKRVPNNAKITPFEITTFGFGQTQMQSFYRNIMNAPKSYVGGYMPSSLILNSLTTANIDKILKTLNKVKYNSPMVLGYMTFERTDDEGKKYLEQLESPDICPLATLVMVSPFNNSTPQKEKFVIRMQKFYYAHLYETIVLMHLLCAPNLSNKQYCDIIKRIREGLLEIRKLAEISVAYQKQTASAISTKLSDTISRTRRLSLSLFNFALTLYITPFNKASDWGYDSLNTDGKDFKRPFLDNAFWADNNPKLKEGLFSGKFSKYSTLKLRRIPFTFKLPNDDLILCKEPKQSVNSAKLIFELVRDILPKNALMTTTNYSKYESPYEFLLGLTQTEEVYMALWKSRNKLQIPPQAFGYSCLKPDFLQIGYDKKKPIYNTFYNQTIFDTIMKEYGKDAFVKEHLLEYALSPALLTRLSMNGQGTKSLFAGYGSLGIRKRNSTIQLLQVGKTDPIAKKYLKSNMDKMEDPVFFLNHSTAILSRILPEMNGEEAQKIADEYLHYTFNACLGNLYTGTKENPRSMSNFTKAKSIKDLYSQTDYSFAYLNLIRQLLNRFFKSQFSDELQQFFLSEQFAIADMYDLESEPPYEILDEFMDYFMDNPNSNMSEYVYMKCYNEGIYLPTLAKHKDTPIEIITELFADYPVEVLQNSKLPKRVFNRLFKATETILKAPIGEDKFRLKTSLTSANVKQKNDAYKNQNTLSMLLRSDRKGVNKRADVRRFIESFPYIQYWRGGNEKKGVFNTIEKQNLYTEGIADDIIMPDSPAFWIIALDDVENEYKWFPDEDEDESPTFTIKGARFHYIESIEETAEGYSVKATTWQNCPSVFPSPLDPLKNQNGYGSSKTFKKDEIHQLFYKKKDNKEGEPRWEVDMLFVLQDSEFEKLANQAEYPDWRYTWSQQKSDDLMKAFIQRSEGKAILNKINEMVESGKHIIRGKPNEAGVSKQLATYGIPNIIHHLAHDPTYLWTPSLWDACAEHIFTNASNKGWSDWFMISLQNGDFKMTKLFKSILFATSKKELGELGYPAISEDSVMNVIYRMLPSLGKTWSGELEDSWLFQNPEFVAELEHHLKMIGYEINNYEQARVKAQQEGESKPLSPPYYTAFKNGYINESINKLQNRFFAQLQGYMQLPNAAPPADYIKKYNAYKPIREAYNKRATQLRKNAPYIQTKEGGANLTPNLQQVANIRDNQ